MLLHHFALVAIEIPGPFGPSALELLKDIGQRIQTTSQTLANVLCLISCAKEQAPELMLL